MEGNTLNVPGSRFVLAAAVCAALAGCASSGGKFACPAPDGVTCMSPTEIYEATNRLDNLEDGQARYSGKDVALPAGADGSAYAQGAPLLLAHRPSVTREGAALALVGQAPATMADIAPGIPMRKPAQIMRIWIAPWSDASGDLHMPGFIYTEIRGRTWSVGQGPAPVRSQLFDPNARFNDRPVSGGG